MNSASVNWKLDTDGPAARFMQWASARLAADEIDKGTGPIDVGLSRMILNRRAARRIILGIDRLPFIGFQQMDFLGLDGLEMDSVKILREGFIIAARIPETGGRLELGFPSMATERWAGEVLKYGKTAILSFEMREGAPAILSFHRAAVPFAASGNR